MRMLPRLQEVLVAPEDVACLSDEIMTGKTVIVDGGDGGANLPETLVSVGAAKRITFRKCYFRTSLTIYCTSPVAICLDGVDCKSPRPEDKLIRFVNAHYVLALTIKAQSWRSNMEIDSADVALMVEITKLLITGPAIRFSDTTLSRLAKLTALSLSYRTRTRSQVQHSRMYHSFGHCNYLIAIL
jgi:hypothetical protein